MNTQAKTLYTARVRTRGGLNGRTRSSDGRLDIHFSGPGANGSGTNPEQLFAAGWSACFASAVAIAARTLKVNFVAEPIVDAEVDLNVADETYFLGARLLVAIPGLNRDLALGLIEEAHRTCPYFNATRGNIKVAVTLV